MSRVERRRVNEFISAFYFMLLRMIAFCLDDLDDILARAEATNENHPSQRYTFANYIFYTQYPTFLFVASFVSFKKFRTCIAPSESAIVVQANVALSSAASNSWQRALIDLSRVLASFLLIEGVLRATSVYSMIIYHEHESVISHFSASSYALALWLVGSLFAAKYVVYYGLTGVINQLVGMQSSPLPRCISLMHTSAEMWRHFDTGIYDFIKKWAHFINKYKKLYKHS